MYVAGTLAYHHKAHNFVLPIVLGFHFEGKMFILLWKKFILFVSLTTSKIFGIIVHIFKIDAYMLQM
jgi:hypothetical protein